MTLGSSPIWFIFWFVILQKVTTFSNVTSQWSHWPFWSLKKRSSIFTFPQHYKVCAILEGEILFSMLP